MPELPDVEAQRRFWQVHASGRTVSRVSAPARDVLRNTSPQALGRRLKGRCLDTPRRHGKWLFAPTDAEAVVVLHFAMSGRLVATGDGEPLDRHDRVVFAFDDGQVRMRMPRKLGGVWLAGSAGDLPTVTGDLGPDAWGIDADVLRDRLAPRGGIKAALMDQSKLAGLGNLLADELLWQARIHPRQPARDIADWRRMAERLQAILDTSVEVGCVPAKDGWLTAVRDDPGPRCPRCGARVRADTVAGRSTRWCPRCQPSP